MVKYKLFLKNYYTQAQKNGNRENYAMYNSENSHM